MSQPKISVYWWNNNRDDITPHSQWDSGMLHWLLHDELKYTGYLFSETLQNRAIHPDLPRVGVVILAARHHADEVQALNEYIAQLEGVVLVLLGDEEAVFPWREVVHPNLRFWVMMPHPIKHADLIGSAYFFGTGCKEDTAITLSDLQWGGRTPRDLAWSFAGQVTHPRRKQAVDGLKRALPRVHGEIHASSSFTGGLERTEYLRLLALTKIAPCPSGPVTADTMRLYEALEAGCYPIVDTGPEGGLLGYWGMLYPDAFPFWVTHDWETVGGIIETEVAPARYPRNANIGQAWWSQQKWGMARRLIADLQAVGAPPPWKLPEDLVTVVMTCSPIEGSLPTTIQHTLGSICHTAASSVVLAFDGVREEQAHLRHKYDCEVQEILAATLGRHNTAVVARHHIHQRSLMQLALEEVDTPLVLFMEQDTPFNHAEIDWAACIDLLANNALDVLRFHHESEVLQVHEHLMLDHETIEMAGVPLRRTRQFSARPHLARTDWYRRVLDEHFTPKARCFVEDRLHGIVQSEPFERNRVAIYHPQGSICRTLHTDGRNGGPKYDRDQVF